jgi:PAS domain S-box-containing protein
MNGARPVTRTIPTASLVAVLTVFAVASLLLVAAGRRDYPDLHTILDTATALLSGILAFLFWDLSARNKQTFFKWCALAFAFTSFMELLHVLVTVEWTGPLARIQVSADSLRPATWSPAANLLPLSLIGALWLKRRDGRLVARFALVLLLLNAALIWLFLTVPRYSPPTFAGITRPSLLSVPLLWGLAAWLFWRFRAFERVMPALALMSVVMTASQIAMLYSGAPHDNAAMVAHLGKASGYLVLLFSVMRLASIDMFERIGAERELVQLNHELEARVAERTAELNSVNETLTAEVIVRRMTEQEARDGQAQTAGIVNSAMDAIISVNDAQNIVLFNAAAERMFHCSAVQALGRPLEQFIPERFRAHHHHHVEGFGHTGVTSRSMRSLGTLNGLRATGEEFPIEASISQIEVAGEKIYTVILRDVTERKAAELASSRLAEIVGSSQDAIVSKDLNSMVTSWNHGAEKIFGYTEGEMIGSSIMRIIPADRQEEENRILAAIRRGERVQHFETRRVTKGGGVIDVSVTVSPIKDANGRVMGMSKVARDITERKLSEEALSEHARILDLAPVLISDLENRIVFWNTGAEQLYGWTSADALGQVTYELFQTEFPIPREEIHATLLSQGHWEGELVHTRHDGRRVIVASHWVLHRDQAGEPKAIMEVNNDITERRQAEAARQTSEDRYRTLFDYAPEGIVIADTASNYLDANVSICRMLGYSRDELIGKNAADIVAFEEVPYIGQALRVINSESEYQREWRFKRKDGSTFAAEVIATAMPDGNLLGVIRDITERKLAEDERRASEERYRTLFEYAPVGIFIVSPENDYIDANPSISSIFGYSRDEFLTLHAQDIVVPEEHQHISKARKVNKSGSRLQREWKFRRKDGSKFAAEVISTPMPDGNLLAMVRDITERKKAEQAVRESEDQFRTMANSIPQLAWVARADGFITWYNQRWHDYTGTTAEQMEGWGWQSVHDPEFLPRVVERWQTAIATGLPLEMEFPLRRADGQFRRFLTRVQPLKDAEGKVVQWFGTNTDVDELKQMEESLRDAQSRLNSTLSAGSIGTWTWDIVNDRLFADEFIAGKFSLDVDEAAAGLPVAAYLQALHEEDQPLVSAALNHAVETCGPYDIEYRVRRAGGETCWLQAKGRVECDVAGQALSFHGTVADINERKLAEEALLASEARLRVVTENARVGLVMIDQDRRYTFANGPYAEIFGLPSANILGQRVADVLAPLYKEQIGPRLDQAFAGQRVSYELNRASAEGRRFYAVSYEPMATGAERRVVVVITEITERKLAEDEIRRLNAELEQRVEDRTAQLLAVNKELEAFSYSVSHDLRAPLRHINGFSQALLEDYAELLDDAGKGFLNEVRGASREMAQLIDDLLQLAKITRSEMHRERVDLSALAREVVAGLRQSDPDRQVTVRIADGLSAHGDKRLLKVCLVNLLGNAWKFTAKQDQAEIEFIGTEAEGVPAFAVRDNGAGFDMAFVKKLFGAFQRLHAGNEFEGTGIGLATVQRVINRHGGRVWAQGVVNRGATFSFTLPAQTGV